MSSVFFQMLDEVLWLVHFQLQTPLSDLDIKTSRVVLFSDFITFRFKIWPKMVVKSFQGMNKASETIEVLEYIAII